MPSRTVWAGAVALAAFAAAAAVTLQFLGSPLRPVDYFLGGSVGTFAALVALFVTFLRPSDWRSLFYKTRRVRTRPSRTTKTLDI